MLRASAGWLLLVCAASSSAALRLAPGAFTTRRTAVRGALGALLPQLAPLDRLSAVAAAPPRDQLRAPAAPPPLVGLMVANLASELHQNWGF